MDTKQINWHESEADTEHLFEITELASDVGQRPVFLIPVERETYLRDRIAKLGRRALKLGLAAPGMRIVGKAVLRPRTKNEAPGHYCLVQVFGEAPRVAGFEFVATIEPVGESNLLRSVPTAELAGDELSAYRDCDPTRCEHCNVRRGRKMTYVVREIETGNLRQVGRSCLGQYLGGISPEHVAEYAKRLAEISSGGAGGEGTAPFTVDLSFFLARCCATIRVDGYASRTKAREDWTGQTRATADVAVELCEGVPSGARSGVRAWHKERWPTDADKDKAEELLAHALVILTGDSDYEHNLLTVARLDWITARQAGYAAAILAHADRDLLRRKEAEQRRSRHVGEVKKALEFGGVLDRVTNLGDRGFGIKYLYRFIADDDAVVVWFSTTVLDAALNDRVRFRSTVKAHEEFRGAPQTVVTRVRKFSVVA